MEKFRRSIGVNVLGWSVCVSNIFLFISYYFVLITKQVHAPEGYVSVLSIFAVFPKEFYHQYLSDFWLAHLIWILTALVCAMGILLLNSFARTVFIVLNALHIAIWAALVVSRWGTASFLDYFFKSYFNLLASGTYIAFLTLPDIREDFKVDLERMKVNLWFEKYWKRKPGVPKDAQGYAKLGMAYGQLKRYESAIPCLQKAVDLNPKDEKSFFHLGEFFYKEKRYADAVHAFKQTAVLNPVFPDAFYNLGVMYQKQGCDNEAVLAFEKAAQVRPKDAKVYKSKGDSLKSLKSYEDAVKAYQRAMELNKNDATLLFELGKVLVDPLGRVQDALDVLRRLVRLKPDLLEAHLLLGRSYQKLEKFKDAIRSFKEVLRRDPDHKNAHYQLGYSYAMIKDTDSAKREVRLLKEFDNDLAETLDLMIK